MRLCIVGNKGKYVPITHKRDVVQRCRLQRRVATLARKAVHIFYICAQLPIRRARCLCRIRELQAYFLYLCCKSKRRKPLVVGAAVFRAVHSLVVIVGIYVLVTQSCHKLSDRCETAILEEESVVALLNSRCSIGYNAFLVSVTLLVIGESVLVSNR